MSAQQKSPEDYAKLYFRKQDAMRPRGQQLVNLMYGRPLDYDADANPQPQGDEQIDGFFDPADYAALELVRRNADRAAAEMRLEQARAAKRPREASKFLQASAYLLRLAKEELDRWANQQDRGRWI